MTSLHLAFSLLLFSALHFLAFAPSPPPSDSSSETILPSLKDVVRAIAAKQRWRAEDVRVSRVEASKARVGRSRRYDFRVGVSRSVIDFRFSDGVASWRRIRRGEEGFGFGLRLPSPASVGTVDLVGPVEVRAVGGDGFSLFLPFNSTHTGLKRVLIGEGITSEVKGALEISLVYPHDTKFPTNRSPAFNRYREQFQPLKPSCAPLASASIIGPATIYAYRTHSPDAHVKTIIQSQDTIELHSEKGYTSYLNRNPYQPIPSINSRLSQIERLVKVISSHKILQKGPSQFLKARVSSTTVVRFVLELERNVRKNDTSWKTMAKVERSHFEVLAKLEGEVLKPIMVEKLVPFVAVESKAWSNIMSNISFTQFPSVVVPPEALTLDIRW
ncbi:hypothetical protein QJS10_CPA05g01528 [Acorus calamus]|uniref:Uncharacterized protein n=1 Tax=Acorus calamus TaxID=4465 RepID=A0AAV9ETF0_ACOCL|nr:hypothetical protein QJS10_CPA05g01528 [Acorus calamus]